MMAKKKGDNTITIIDASGNVVGHLRDDGDDTLIVGGEEISYEEAYDMIYGGDGGEEDPQDDRSI